MIYNDYTFKRVCVLPELAEHTFRFDRSANIGFAPEAGVPGDTVSLEWSGKHGRVALARGPIYHVMATLQIV